MAAISHVCRRTLPSFPFFFPCLFHQRKAKRKHILRSFSVSPNTDGIKILFPGQGSQYVGMTTRLLPLCSAALNVFSIASSVLGYDIQDLCVNGPQDKIQQTIYCQPAIVVSCLVAFEQMKHNNPSIMSRCAAMAGFSVGEITAFIASNAIPLDKGLELVSLRASLMQRACKQTESAMATIIGLDEETMNDICRKAENKTGGIATIGNYIFPKGHVVSADIQTLEVVSNMISHYDNVSYKPVSVSGAFHSSLMSSAIPELKEFLKTIEFEIPKFPIYSNVTGLPHSNNEVKELLTQQIVHPVKWEQCMINMIENYGNREFYEIGPGRQLKMILRRIDKTVFQYTRNIEV